MTDHVMAVPDVGANVRWWSWYNRGATRDRRTRVKMGTLTVLIAVSLLTWLLAGLF